MVHVTECKHAGLKSEKSIILSLWYYREDLDNAALSMEIDLRVYIYTSYSVYTFYFMLQIKDVNSYFPTLAVTSDTCFHATFTAVLYHSWTKAKLKLFYKFT